jgi:hypothetical protein
MNYHTLLYRGSTGGREFGHPFDFNYTELTSFIFPGGGALCSLISPVYNLYRLYFPGRG